MKETTRKPRQHKERLKEKEPWDTKIRFFDRISAKNRTILFKHLSTMIKAGIPIDKALLAIHRQSSSRSFHRILHIILRDLDAGEGLGSSMKSMPRVFNDLTVSLVEVGEKSGTLPTALQNISNHFEKAGDLKGKILGAMLYPMIVVVGTIATVGYLVFILLPQILPLFDSLDVEIPWTTRFVIFASDFLAQYGILLGIALIIFSVLFSFALRVEKFRYVVHALVLRVPIVGPLIGKTQITQFAQMLSVLLESGVTIVEALKISGNSLSNRVYRRSLLSTAEYLQEGENLSVYLEDHSNLFSPLITQVISVGEETGRLQESFTSIAEFTEDDLDEAVKIMTALLEPILMVIIGGIVGFVALAVITPIYELTSGIGR